MKLGKSRKEIYTGTSPLPSPLEGEGMGGGMQVMGLSNGVNDEIVIWEYL